MKLWTVLLILAAVLVAGAEPALAWRGGVFVGVGPLWYPAPFPYLYPAPPVYVYPAPPVVIERPAPPAYVESPPPEYWYYCEDPTGYYPYVQQCLRGWMRVVPQAPPAR